jgi:hypothetical protein
VTGRERDEDHRGGCEEQEVGPGRKHVDSLQGLLDASRRIWQTRLPVGGAARRSVG